jgi:TPR repeat protein/transglutaminase-like putative cysteine protease
MRRQRTFRGYRVLGAGVLLCMLWLGLAGAEAESGSDKTSPSLAVPTPSAPVASATSPAVRAELELAGRLMSGRGLVGDPAAGAALTERLAESGNSAAQMLVAGYYLGGLGVEQKPDVAAGWMRKAADQNLPQAQAQMAFFYLRGLGIPTDYPRALRLAQAAADRGVADGEDALGYIYANGLGVSVDGSEARKWLMRAANRNFEPAMYHLGQAYREGKAFPADKVLAFAWFSIAAANSRSPLERDNAARARDDLAETALPDDLAIGRQLAVNWKPGVDPAASRASAAAPKPSGPGDAPAPAADLVVAGAAPTLPLGEAPGKPLDLPTALKLLTQEYEVQPDGSYTLTIHEETEVKNEAGVKTAGQVPVPFGEQLQKVDVLDAYTLKRDGRKLPVDASAIHTQLRPGAPTEPMFDDQRQKVVIFPDLEIGDTTVVTVRFASKPLIPGLFSMTYPLNRTLLQDDTRVTVRAPKSLPLVTETHDVKFEQHTEGDRTIYEWRFANANPIPENLTALDPRDRWPRLLASSFRSYDQLGSAYLALAQPKIAVTPAVQKMADEITAGVSDKRKQAELIYYWVSRHIRYVALEFGTGAVVPHEANSVLANSYGDCKDHTVLFAALLKAKGIASTIVLINLGNSYSLGTVPTLGSLNHVITWLPDFKIYADTTDGVAPFGTLPFGEYGKPVVHATASGPALQRTPTLAANLATSTIKTTAHLDAQGRITGDSETSATGPLGLALRHVALSIQSAGSEQAARLWLRSKGFEGSGRFEFGSPSDPAAVFRITGHFQTDPRMDLLSGNSLFLPVGLAVGTRPGDYLMGLLAFRDFRGLEPTPCFSGREVEELSLELPENRRLRELPKGTEIKNQFISYKSEWSQSGRTVTVRREFTSTMDQPVCIGDTRALAARALNDIRRDYNSPVALVPN